MNLRSAVYVVIMATLLAGGSPLRPAAAWTYMSDYSSHGYSYGYGYGSHGSGYNFRVGGYGQGYSTNYDTSGGVSDPLGSRRWRSSANAVASTPLWWKLLTGARERPLCGNYNREPAACTNTTTRYVADVLRQD